MRAALFVTGFADQAVVLPVTLAVALALLLLGWRPAARAWVLCVGATLSATLLLKLMSMACGLGAAFGVVSPSGHTAAAACVYGGGLGLLARRRRAGTLAAGVGALGVACIIGTTRLWLGVHTLADVCVGGAAGACGAAALRAWAGERPAALPVWRCGAAALAAMLLFHGRQLDAEPRLRWAASRIWPLSLCAPAPRTEAAVNNRALPPARTFRQGKTRG